MSLGDAALAQVRLLAGRIVGATRNEKVGDDRVGLKSAGHGATITTGQHSEAASHGTKRDTGRSSLISCQS